MLDYILIVALCVVVLLRYLAFEFEWLDRLQVVHVYDTGDRCWTTTTLYRDKHWRSHGYFIYHITKEG